MQIVPLKMYYSTQVFHREYDPLAVPPKYGDQLCANVVSAEVNVFKISNPDPYGAQFLYHYSYKGNVESALADPALSNVEWNNYYLMCSLSATNGWGTGNCRCFTPLDSYGDGNYLQEE